MRGLAAVAQSWHPTHVLIDSDPASLMVLNAARACPGAEVWALTAENLPANYLSEFGAGLAALNPLRAAAPLLKIGLRMLVHRRVQRVFTLSNDGSRVMSGLGFAGRVSKIPLGFDPALFRIQDESNIAATRAKLGLNAPTIAYFGRLTPEKGMHFLLEALAALKDLSWQLLLDRFSDYPSAYAETVRTSIAALGLEDRVVYFNAGHEQMPDFMNAADLVVLPSISTPRWKEQYGRVLPEAMACGKQVIGSNSGTIPELVSDQGILVHEADAKALCGAIRTLLVRADFRSGRDRISAYAHANLSIRSQAAIWAGLLR